MAETAALPRRATFEVVAGVLAASCGAAYNSSHSNPVDIGGADHASQSEPVGGTTACCTLEPRVCTSILSAIRRKKRKWRLALHTIQWMLRNGAVLAI